MQLSEAFCQVCFNPKRKLRFRTHSLSICQWCVTELTTSLESPAEIICAARLHMRAKRMSVLTRDLAVLDSERKPAPELSDAEFARIATRAKQQVLETEGVGKFLYRQLVDDAARKSEAFALERQLQASLVASHREKTQAHVQRMSALETRIADVRSNIEAVDRVVEEDFKQFMALRIAPRTTKFRSTRILRAHGLGILQPERTFAQRPEGSEAEEMGRYIRKRDGHVCTICHRVPRGSELHVHHIIPLSSFGTNSERNLATLCYSCHNRQHPEFKVSRMHPTARGRTSEV